MDNLNDYLLVGLFTDSLLIPFLIINKIIGINVGPIADIVDRMFL